MATPTRVHGRLAELLAGEAAGQIAAEEQAELERLLAATPAANRDAMMQAAGLAQVAFLGNDATGRRAMPAVVRQRLARQADAWQAGRRAGAPIADLDAARPRRETGRPGVPRPAPKARRNGFGAMGWYAAAALALAVVLMRFGTPELQTAAADRAALIEQAPDLLRRSWGRSAEPGYAGASGDVVWSGARQEGYLRLAGLPANDPTRQQYQLWVVDPGRDARPVDGGVFDVPAGGEVIIPIRAKLRVDHPAAFAVTLEKPGGVVVSAGPMLLVAAVGG